MTWQINMHYIFSSRTFWTPDQLKRHVISTEHKSSKFDVQLGDSLEDKLDFFDIEASLRMSFLCGLISVGGSGAYLRDHRTSSHVSRATLKYQAMTRFEQLSMYHLNRSNIQYPEVFGDSKATHVVVGELLFITSRVCGRGNVFVVCVCVCVSVLSVWAITFEPVDIETSFLVWCYILTISRSSLSIKVIGQGQGHLMENASFTTWTSV